MNKSLKILGILLFVGSPTLFGQSQPNKFIIGAYGLDNYTANPDYSIRTQPETLSGYNSSFMNVIAEDGMNTVMTYNPSEQNYTMLMDYITLVKNNNLKYIDYNTAFFKPNQGTNATGGFNRYDLSLPYDITDARYNLDRTYNNVYRNAALANTIIGHTLGGELSFLHAYAYDNVSSVWQDANNSEFKKIELPPQNLSDALKHFKEKKVEFGLINQNLIFGVAVHGGYVEGYTDNTGSYDEEDYVLMNNVTNPQKPDIFDEGSYFSDNFKDWDANPTPDRFYLGKFKSIDFGKSHFSSVIAEISIEQDDENNPQYKYVYHSNPAVPNANHLWFQTYTSIIHGVNGIVFWSLTSAYKTSVPADDVNRNYYGNDANLDRYERAHSPLWYQLYVANLSRELRYLVDEGFLSTDPNTIVYSKTGANVPDPNCILPASTTYLPVSIAAVDARDYKLVRSLPGLFPVNNVHRTEEYGLRYTIRTNGNEVVMIVSNPNPYSVHNVEFNFDYISNPAIRNANGVDVLFDDGSVSNVNSTSYKIETATIHKRSGGVNDAFDLLKKYHIAFDPGEKNFSADFGPFDVKVFKFTEANEPSYSDDWTKVWTNNGNKGIGSWTAVTSTDKFITGDFDNNGKEELLAFSTQNSMLQEFDEATLSWNLKWTNSGNSQLAGDWPLNQAHRYYSGDFNGDNRTDLLCVSGMNGYMNIYNYLNGSWSRIWTNSGTNNIGGWSGVTSTDKFYVADFDGNGKDDLMALQNATNAAAKWIVIQEFNPANLTWTWKWSNSGNDKLAADWPLNTSHKYFVDDYNGDGKADVYCVSGTNNYTNMYSYNNGFNLMWSNSGSPDNLISSAAWPLPFKSNVAILSGNVENDSKSELMFIDRELGGFVAQKAQTSDINSTTVKLTRNWDNFAGGYINDWPLNGGNENYYFINASGTRDYLLAMRNYAGSCSTPNYLVSLYKVNNPNSNFRDSGNEIEDENPETIENSLSITDEVSLLVFPNPNNGVMRARTFINEGQGILKLYSIEGVCVANYVLNAGETNLEIIQTNLAAGIYYFDIMIDGKVVTRTKINIVK